MSWRQGTGRGLCAPTTGSTHWNGPQQKANQGPGLKTAAMLGLLAGAALFGAVKFSPSAIAAADSQLGTAAAPATTDPDDGTAACLVEWLEFWDCQELGRDNCEEPNCEL